MSEENQSENKDAEENLNDANAFPLDTGNANTSATALMHEVDNLLSHIWMVRAFLKHSDEAAEDEELAEVHRGLYDFMLALGPALDAKDASRYLRIARKKIGKLRAATQSFEELQPEISGHMNFRMAAKSLSIAVSKVSTLLSEQQ